jgi:hypothetical protein
MRHNAAYAAYGISGDPAPSTADVQITHLLREAAKTVEISLVDHVIVLSKALDKMIYAKCWIMLSFSDAAFRFRGDTVIRLRSRFA